MKTYPIVNYSFSLDEFCFRAKARNYDPLQKGKYKNVVDALRTVYWFHELKIRNKTRSIYELEKLLEPEAFKVDKYGEKYRHNKWRGYSIGKHTPSQSRILKVDQTNPGTQTIFNHVLWDVLRLDLSATSNAIEWFARIEPEIQILLFSRSNTYKEHRNLTSQAFEAIERRASLSALACLTIIARKASEEGNSEYAFEVGYRICRMLLLCGREFMCHGVATPIHEFYELFILPLTAHNYLHYCYRTLSYISLIGFMNDRLWHLEGVNPNKLTKSEQLRYEQKILGWNYGFDCLYIFQPEKLVIDPEFIKNDVFLRYWEAQVNLKEWGYSGCWYESIKPYKEREKTIELRLKLWAAEEKLLKYLQLYSEQKA